MRPPHFRIGLRVGRALLLALALLAARAVLAPSYTQAQSPQSHTDVRPGGAHAPVAPVEGVVRIHDTRVFSLRVPRAGMQPAQRAANATSVLERLVDERTERADVRVEQQGSDVAVVYAGASPVIQLGLDDAVAAGDSSLSVHADSVATRVRDALHLERQRSAIAQTVFSFSLLIFAGLMAVLLLRKVGELVDRARAWMVDEPSHLPVVRVQGIEVIQPTALRGGLLVALSGGKALVQLGVLYAWVLISLSLFDATRGYTERLTGFVLTPLSTLMGRAASSLPLIVITGIAALVMIVTVRFVGLFFGSVARGETRLGWLPQEVATPTGVLVRSGIVVVALIVAAPLLTGNDDGALSRAGIVTLVAIGLASTPVLACAAVGVAVVYAQRLKVGDYADVGGRFGRVHSITLLEVRLEDDDGCELRVPHLLSLLHPTRIVGRLRLLTLDLTVAAQSPHTRVREILRETAGSHGTHPTVDLLGIDADGARYRVGIYSNVRGARTELALAAATALDREHVRLGRARRDALAEALEGEAGA